MSPEQTTLLSDAMKMGFPVIGTVFGAAIGALSTFAINRASRKHEAAKEYSKRRFDLLLQAANDVTEFEQIIGRYATAVNACIHGQNRDEELKDAYRELVTKNQPLRRARMTLKLLGLTDAGKHLEAYLDITREVVKSGANLSKERINELLPIVVFGPVNFYSSLAIEFGH